MAVPTLPVSVRGDTLGEVTRGGFPWSLDAALLPGEVSLPPDGASDAKSWTSREPGTGSVSRSPAAVYAPGWMVPQSVWYADSRRVVHPLVRYTGPAWVSLAAAAAVLAKKSGLAWLLHCPGLLAWPLSVPGSGSCLGARGACPWAPAKRGGAASPDWQDAELLGAKSNLCLNAASTRRTFSPAAQSVWMGFEFPAGLTVTLPVRGSPALRQLKGGSLAGAPGRAGLRAW